MKVKIHVTLKKSVLDPQGEAIRKGLLSLGFDEVTHVRMGKYFELDVSPVEGKNEGKDKGKNVRERIRLMCEKMLANPVIEDFTVDFEPEGR